MTTPKVASPLSSQPVSLPNLAGRIAVLGGSDQARSQLLVGLAVRQVQQKGVALCLDGCQQKHTEVQFRLLLRGAQHYIALPPPGEVSKEVARTALSLLSRGLSLQSPLLLLNAVQETPDWSHTVVFLLNAGVIIVDMLTDGSQLTFGRYDTVLLLRSDQDTAEAYSKTVGRRATAQEIFTIPI